MNSDLFYLKDTRTGKYHSPSGLTSDIELATKFTELQLKNRLGIPKTYTNVFKEKMKNGFLSMESVFGNEKVFFDIKSDLSYERDDILFCNAIFKFKKGIITKKVVYSEARNNLKIPENKDEYFGCELRVLKIVGKINPD